MTTSSPAVQLLTRTTPLYQKRRLNLTSSQMQSRENFAISFRNCQDGLGIKVIGGAAGDADHGIYIKRLIRDRLALTDGRVHVGDKLVRVNGHSLESISYSEALRLLQEATATGQVTLVISRTEQAKSDFENLMDEEITSESSRATTPLNNLSFSTASDSVITHPLNVSKDLQTHIDVTYNLEKEKSDTEPMASTPYDPEYNQHRLLPHHLQSSSKLSGVFPLSAWSSSAVPSAVNPNLEPNVRLPVANLETSLRFLGINPTEQERTELLSNITVDKQGTVCYGDFVRVAREIFHKELQSREMNSNFPQHENFDEPDVARSTALGKSDVKLNTTQGVMLSAEIQQVQSENNSLRKKIHTLSRQLHEQVLLTARKEKELLAFRKEAHTALDETVALKEKVALATEAQKMAEQVESDFEAIIAKLEKEVVELREREAKQMESAAVRRKLAVLGAQLRKSENSRSGYQTANQKLLDFVQRIHDVMAGLVHEETTPRQLSVEALQVMNAAKTMVENEALPFGWEECFTADGSKYFINHVTQETTWQHPVTRRTGF